MQSWESYLAAWQVRPWQACWVDRDSFTLAVARYMKEHPLLTDIPIRWLDFEQVSKWQAMSTAELQDEALRRLEQLEKWDELTKANHPDVWETFVSLCDGKYGDLPRRGWCFI